MSDRFARREELAPGVWLAYDERLGREVVLKRAAAGEPRAMARLNHPHVITVYEHVDGWAVLEYAPGGSLAERQLSAGGAARIGVQIADALVYMHGKGLVHCDVKPGNIVLAEDGTAKLTDFGSAYRIEPEQTITPVSRLSYTPGYAPPELERGSPVPASDVFSLAAAVCALAPALNDALADLLKPDPRGRPTAVEARRLLQAIIDGAAPTMTGPGPAQLPGDVHGFAGRTTELDRLDRQSAPVVVISGTAGVGKTTLAVHWTHRIARWFPDGQLYVNLRGFDPTGQVMDPADAIRGFLDALGIAPERIPVSLDAQAALYRSTLSGKRMLIVLDNARDADQVRPLLPGNPNCQVIVTSRNDLLGLIANHGARPLTLDVLTDTEARQLLDHRLGSDRTAAEPQAVDQIIQSCARLPLALAVAAARAAIRPDFPLTALTNALSSDDPDTDVNTVFSWSYQQLSGEAQRLFRLLGLHPGPDISAPAAASLFGTPQPPLAELTRAHLIDEHKPGRYTSHDLLRAYAAELAAADDQQAAIHRMLDHYLHSAHTADRLLDAQRRLLAPASPRTGVNPERPATYEEAMGWLTTEHAVLLAAIDHAATAGFDVHAWQLAWNLDSFLFRRGHWHDRAFAWQVALNATQRIGDRSAQVRAHRLLAGTHSRLGHFDDAHTHLQHALDLGKQLGDKEAQAHTHLTLGRLCERQGRSGDALDHDTQAHAVFQEIGDRYAQAMALNNIGWDHAHLGNHQLAHVYCGRALKLFQEIGDRDGEADTWDSIGYAHHHLRQFQDALDCYERALDLYRNLGNRYDASVVLTHVGDTEIAVGDREAARATWRQALSILEELEHPDADGVRAKLEQLERGP